MEYGENIEELIETLQTFPQYHELTMDDIIGQFGTIDELKAERDLLVEELVNTLQYFDQYKNLTVNEIINLFPNMFTFILFGVKFF